MTVAELRALLANAPDDAPVVAVYEANCCTSDDLGVALIDGQFIINCDGPGFL